MLAKLNDLLLYIKTEEKVRANHLSAAISLICLTLRKRNTIIELKLLANVFECCWI